MERLMLTVCAPAGTDPSDLASHANDAAARVATAWSPPTFTHADDGSTVLPMALPDTAQAFHFVTDAVRR